MEYIAQITGDLKRTDVDLPTTTNNNEHTGSSELRVYQENHVCVQNTTNTPLGSNETFTGEWQDCLNYQEVNVSIISDQNSATNGLVIEWSDDAITVGDDDRFSIYANAGTNYTPNPAFRYVRVKYTNGSVAQTTFHLMTILRRGVTGGSFHRIDSTLKDDSDARLNITVPKLKTAANTYVSQTATTAGNAKISIEELETGVSDNNKTQLKTSMYGKTGDSTFQVPRIDASTHTLQTMEYEHHEIHAGSHYNIADYATFSNGEVKDFTVITPNTTTWAHMTFSLVGTGGLSIEIYEDAVVNVAGTAVTKINNNRNSANTSVLTIRVGDTFTSTGTRIKGYYAGALNRTGIVERSQEKILKQNTTYLFRITNQTAVNNIISWNAEWYEHVNKTA